MMWRPAATLAAVLTAGGVVLLTGCTTAAGPVAGSATAAAPASTSTAPMTTPAATTSGPAPSESVAGGTVAAAPLSDDPAVLSSQSAARESRLAEIAAATPAKFDTQTAAWFDAICQPFADLTPSTYDEDGNDNLSAMESLTYFRAMSETFTATSESAASLPPPTIGGGADLVSQLTASLSESGTKFGALVDQASASTAGPSQEILDILREASQSYITSGYSPISGLDPSVIAALHPLPSCAAVGW